MRIVLFGTGNLATRLGIALSTTDVEIAQVYGRTESKASNLAAILGCSFTSSGRNIVKDADLYLLAVSDDAIMEVLENVPLENRLVAHTSGSVAMETLVSSSKNYGVFYPLQTLSAQKEIDFKTIPICIEANNEVNLGKLRKLAEKISDSVVKIDSVQRRQLHLAAVFVCNFVNHFYSIGEKLVEEHGMDFLLLKPLILETALKATQFSPRTVQTGPAIRNNTGIMDLHLKMLEQHPDWQRIYEMVSRNISETGKK
jgi:predicted short-subunit dehydrogenase-like oxidoreductase (DUF2520 family)